MPEPTHLPVLHVKEFLKENIPPGSIRFVMTEFSGKEDARQSLEQESLDCNDRNHTEEGFADRPSFKEPEDFKHDEQYNDSDSMADSSKDGAEFLAAYHQTRTHTTSHAKQS